MTGASVSVVMPAQNAAPYVGAAIASVVAQPVDGLELIVVDDGSTDDTRAIVDRWCTADARVRVVRGTSRGAGEAFDLGASVSTGPIVARMDADDVSLPWRLPRQLAFLDARPDVVMLGGLIEIVDPGGGLLERASVSLHDADIRRRLPAHCSTASGGTARSSGRPTTSISR